MSDEKLKLMLDNLEDVSIEINQLCNDYHDDDLNPIAFEVANVKLITLVKRIKGFIKDESTRPKCEDCKAMDYDGGCPIFYELNHQANEDTAYCSEFERKDG